MICNKRIYLAPAGEGTKGSRKRCRDCQGRQQGDPPHDGYTCAFDPSVGNGIPCDAEIIVPYIFLTLEKQPDGTTKATPHFL